MKKLFVVFLLFIVSCSAIGSKTSILDNQKCELPCWNNIIPGETTYSSALQIIQKLDFVDPSKTNDLHGPWKIFSQHIEFVLKTDSSSKNVYIGGVAYCINNKVAMLLLTRNIEKTFSELSEMTSVPEFVVSVPYPNGPSIIAINPSKGVAFGFVARSGDLKPDTRIETVMLFDIAQYQNLLEAGMFSWSEYNGDETMKVVYSWKGYGSVEKLYPVRDP